jgi:hypothetical protein
MRSLAALFLSAISLAGCGQPGPAERCDDLQTLVCKESVWCGTWGSTDACLAQARKSFDCGTVRTVGASYDLCVDEIRQMPCETISKARMPDSCIDAISTRVDDTPETPLPTPSP